MARLKLLVVTLAMLGALFGAACEGGEGDGAVVDFLEILPSDVNEIFYVNMAYLKNDGDLGNMFLLLEDTISEILSSGYGIRLDDLDLAFLAWSETDDERIFALGGLGNLGALRDELDNSAYGGGEVRGVEVWVDPATDGGAFAFLPNGNVLVTGSEDMMEDLLRRREERGSSIYDEVSNLFSSLSAESAVLHILPECISVLERIGCAFMGNSIERDNLQNKLSHVLAFESESDAEDYYGSILSTDSAYPRCEDTKYSRNGSLVTTEAVCGLITIYGPFWGFVEPLVP